MKREKLKLRARRSLSRLARFANRFQRLQLACGPVTVRQCQTLEALMDGPLPMKKLADEVALHQSTLTRVVEKLERKGLVTRGRTPGNRRAVEVALTDSGRSLYSMLDATSTEVVGQVLALLPQEDQEVAVKGLELLSSLLDPRNEEVQSLIAGCCCDGEVLSELLEGGES